MRFTYYADTFILDVTSSSPRWKHVLTRGFPTYRAQAKLFVDPESGRTFLFGGYTNTDFVPDGKHIVSKTFHDLWELKLDVEGGHYENVDQEEEARTASLGPWKRCFNCGSAGPWKKCGGTLIFRLLVYSAHLVQSTVKVSVGEERSFATRNA